MRVKREKPSKAWYTEYHPTKAGPYELLFLVVVVVL